MAKRKQVRDWVNDEKFYISREDDAFTLRRGYLRIDYHHGNSITLTREASDPRDYCEEISADEFRGIREKVFAALTTMLSSHAADPLPEIDAGGHGGSQVDGDEDLGDEDDGEFEDDASDAGLKSDEDFAADLLFDGNAGLEDEDVGLADDDDEK